MRRTLRLGLSVAVLIALVGPAAGGAEEPQLAGVYLSSGSNPDGSEYRGIVDVARQGDSFLVTWMILQTDGETILLSPVAVGVGMRDGGLFAVSYYGSEMAGLVLYRIEDQGRRLLGRWVIAGSDGDAHAETLTKVPDEVSEPAPPEPSDDAKPRAPARPARPSAGRAI